MRPGTAFIHFCSTTNTGETFCAPYHYFPFDDPEIFDLRKPVPSREVMIYGGGALGYELVEQGQLHPDSLKIAWGVGISRHGETLPGRAPDGFSLFGSREWGQENSIYVPCVSCMSPLFDVKYEIKTPAVFFANDDPWIQNQYPARIPELPTLINAAPLEEIIAFLASGETVITNSYHGAYWGTLLGRKVVLYKPYSSKFFSYQFQPAIAENDDWQSAIVNAPTYPHALAESRAATMKFVDLVSELIDR
jgi:hypothetical protein